MKIKLLAILLIIAGFVLSVFLIHSQKSVLPQIATNNAHSLPWSLSNVNSTGATADGYYLCNNTIKSVSITELEGKKSMTVTAIDTTSAPTAVDRRNTHFYDVIDLVRRQGVNPSNGVYRVEYIGVDEEFNEEVIHFVLDENLLLDIQDSYITYTNLYEYCLDLQLHDTLK